MKLDVKGGSGWSWVVDVGGVELGSSIVPTAAAMMVAAKFELKPTRLEFSAVAANVVFKN